MRSLAIVNVPCGDLKPHAHNPRTHSKKQIGQIADSIHQFGFTNPILVDADRRIIAGHGRLEAAKLLGLERVPVICIDDMTEAEIRAYVIADNKLAQNAGWDPELLALELKELGEIDLGFELSITGFEIPEIDLLIQSLDHSPPDAADEVPKIDPGPPISSPGDLWRLGRHRLFCGDATKPEAFAELMGTDQAQMVFTDPPYNVPIDGHVSGLGKIKHAEFAMASGEMSETEFIAFLQTVFRNLADHSTDGSIHFICMDWRHLPEVLTAGKAVYSELKNLCVWNKSNGGMGSLYRSKHELVPVFKNGAAPHINNVELGRHGRYRSNVWDYAGINSFGPEREETLAMHPTVKPTALVADAILDCSRRSDIVLDCFAGSGTTILAAERTGRACHAIEMEPTYVDVSIKRYQQATGKDAIHADTGATFNEIKRVEPAKEITNVG